MLEKIITAAFSVFNQPNFLAIMHAAEPNAASRTGGYLCIMANDTAGNAQFNELLPLAHIAMGTIAEPKRERYFTLSLEKARRLYHADTALLSSWQSRNESLDQKGGAIRAGNFILSFSGLPELGDEAFMLLIAQKTMLLTDAEIGTIGSISGSFELYQKLWASI